MNFLIFLLMVILIDHAMYFPEGMASKIQRIFMKVSNINGIIDRKENELPEKPFHHGFVI